ncbi:MAG: O-antigen ligase family protein [Verrucomicrobiota bacterium]
MRWAFYLSIFTIPFYRFYLPGTGDRIGVIRMVQALILFAALSEPRICIRLFPVAMVWFLAYCGWRLAAGFWLSPEMFGHWWPSTIHWIQYSIPCVWVMFNVLQIPGMARKGLWALIWGSSLCAACHLAGIGVIHFGGLEGRSTVFGENANVIGATYAVAAIAMVGLGMFQDTKLHERLVLLALMAVVLAALAKTGTRTALLIVIMGVALLFAYGRAFGSRAKRFAVLVLAGAVLAGVMSQVPAVVERFEKLDVSRIANQEGRARMIPVLWEIFLRSPVYGSGPDGYAFELTRRAMPHLLREQVVVSSHNLALKLLVETGLIGFALFAWGVVKPALVSAWKARLKPAGSLPLALLLSLVIAGCISAEPSYYLVFWFAVAYALAGEA